jgi:hypothetical protein
MMQYRLKMFPCTCSTTPKKGNQIDTLCTKIDE